MNRVLDKLALKTLYNKYWSSSKGWVNQVVDHEALEYAKNAGYMFEDRIITHDEALKLSMEALNRLTKSDVVNAFVCSLSSRRLDLRSALSSYACGQNLPAHKFELLEYSTSCSICGVYNQTDKVDLNIRNFERFKFGGVRHLEPSYIWLDLMLFQKEKTSSPTVDDLELLKKIMVALKELPDDKLSSAEKSLKFIKSNKTEREGIISTLGYCGILEVPNEKKFFQSYINNSERRNSDYAKSDWAYPTDLWKPSFGLNETVIDYWFGSILS